MVEAVAGNTDARSAIDELLGQSRAAGGEKAAFAQAIELILGGERDSEKLCNTVGGAAAVIIETILRAIADATTLSALLPPEGAGE